MSTLRRLSHTLRFLPSSSPKSRRDALTAGDALLASGTLTREGQEVLDSALVYLEAAIRGDERLGLGVVHADKLDRL